MPAPIRTMLSLLFVFCSLAPAQAHSGKVAIAAPVEGIAVDGDLSDWPADIPWHSIGVVGDGRKPEGEEDFSGRFRVGYSLAENAVYVAVEARDDEFVLERDLGPVWQYFDGCETYLQPSGADSLQMYAAYGPFRLYEKGPNGGTILLPDSTDRIGVMHRGNRHGYEFRLPTDWTLASGQSFGFDVSLIDADADGSASRMLWGGIPVKRHDFDRIGNLILGKGLQSTGILEGCLVGEGVGRSNRHRVQLWSLDQPGVSVHLAADASGRFRGELPAGRYAVAPVGRDTATGRVIVDVKAGASSEVSLTCHPSRGQRIRPGPGKAQRLGQGHPQGMWWTLGKPDGMSISAISGLTHDDRGSLWIATGRGVVQYDGAFLTRYTAADGFPEAPIRVLIRSRQGGLWFAAGSGGLYRFDGEQLTRYTAVDGLGGNYVRALLEDRQGRLWIGVGGGGLCRYDGETFFTYTAADGLANNAVISLFEDRQGNLWIGTEGGGVSRFDGESFTTYTAADGLFRDRVATLVQDDEGMMWFGGIGGWVSRYDGEDFVTFDINQGQPDNRVYCALSDPDGGLWFGTNGGLARYHDGEFFFYGIDEGLGYDQVTALFEDPDGFLWIGGGDGSLTRYNGLRFASYATADDGGGQRRVQAAFTDAAGKVWFGGEAGLFYYDEEADSLARAGFDRKRMGAGITAIDQGGQGDLWLGTWYGGLLRYAGNQVRQFHLADGLPHAEVVAVLAARNGDLWLGTWGGGASRFDGREFHNFNTLGGLPSNVVPALLEDRRGAIWLGTQNGAMRRDGKRTPAFSRVDDLADDPVSALLEDRDGHIWFGTGNGLVEYDGERFRRYTVDHGLIWNSVKCLYEADDGQLWIGTGGGVSRFDGEVFRCIGRRDGLAHDEVWGITQDREGNMWFATSGGVTRYRPGKSRPRISITDVITDRCQETVDEVDVSTAQDYLSFGFVGRSLNTPPGDMLYRYRLRGYEEDWQNSTYGHIEYGHLPRGEYIFEVVAVDQELNYSAEPARVRVRVSLPYERIGLFAGLGCALVLIVVQAGRIVNRESRLRVSNRALATANEELHAKARDLEGANLRIEQANQAKNRFLSSISHELRTPMNAILGFTELLQGNREQNLTDRQQRNLGTIHRNASSLLGLINQLLDLSKIEAGHVEMHVERFAMAGVVRECLVTVEPLLDGKPVELRAGPIKAELQMRSDRAKVKQILLNLVSNAVKFTQEGWVEVRVEMQGTEVRVVVEDTGVGIPEEELATIFEKFRQVSAEEGGTGLGLAIARELCRLLGGEVSAQSAVGEGSTFAVELPVELDLPEEG